jgi:hypothetical protein
MMLAVSNLRSISSKSKSLPANAVCGVCYELLRLCVRLCIGFSYFRELLISLLCFLVYLVLLLRVDFGRP